jgi:hypothetical protein
MPPMPRTWCRRSSCRPIASGTPSNDRLLADVSEPGIRTAFEHLRNASKNSHLPAFARCSARSGPAATGRGMGYGYARGPGIVSLGVTAGPARQLRNSVRWQWPCQKGWHGHWHQEYDVTPTGHFRSGLSHGATASRGIAPQGRRGGLEVAFYDGFGHGEEHAFGRRFGERVDCIAGLVDVALRGRSRVLD